MSKTCSELTAVIGCSTSAAGIKTSVVIHYEYRVSATGARTLHATRYTDAAGAPITPAVGDVISPGACPVATPDVEFEQLCDTSAAGVVTEFFRRSVTTFDALNVPTTTVTDLALDKNTVYTPTGTVGACNQDCDVVAPVGLVATWG